MQVIGFWINRSRNSYSGEEQSCCSHRVMHQIAEHYFHLNPYSLPACSSSPAARCRAPVSQTSVGCAVTGTVCCIWTSHLTLASLRVRKQSELQIAPISWLTGCINPHFLAVLNADVLSSYYPLDIKSNCTRSAVIRVTILPMSSKLSVPVNAFEDNTWLSSSLGKETFSSSGEIQEWPHGQMFRRFCAAVYRDVSVCAYFLSYMCVYLHSTSKQKSEQGGHFSMTKVTFPNAGKLLPCQLEL